MKTEMTSKKYFQSLKSTHLSLGIFSPIFFPLFFSYMEVGIEFSNTPTWGIPLTGFITFPIISILSAIIGLLFYKMKVKKLKNNISTPFKQKTFRYRVILVIVYSIYLVGVANGISSYIYFGMYLSLSISIIPYILFLMLFPSKNRVIKDLNLNKEEQALVNDPNAIICEIKPKGIFGR